MKRALTIATIASALVFAATALGGGKQYHGNTDDELCGGSQVTCDVSFKATVRNGKVTRVDNFLIKGVPMECDQATIVVDSSPGLAVNGMKVNKQRRFSGHKSGSPNAEITVRGRFSKNFRTARGTIVNTLSDPPAVTNCSTGTDSFVAGR